MENKSKVLEYLNIPRSTFYYHSILEEKDLILREKILKVMIDHPSYGHKRISFELKVNRKCIRRVMRKFSMKPSRSRKRAWERGEREELASPNLLVSLFPLYPNHVWVTDFTYLKWQNRWVYVCTVIDLFTREVVGI